jgi:hypothetical protein
MEYSWILPVAEKLYANREDIQNNFQKVSNWLLGEKSTIVITGLPGVGKTVLSDYHRLRRLSNQVGSDNFSWDALPFCGRLDDFTLGTQVYPPQLREKQRDHYIAQFSKKLVAMCKANS